MNAPLQISFTCNVCGTYRAECRFDLIDRETSSCLHCGSTVRFRSIVNLLSIAQFGRSAALPDFAGDKGVVGIGLSDWDGYAARLESKFNYTNTYFHAAPFLDVCRPIPEKWRGICDFVISSDVFEHTMPPAQSAFDGAAALLKPGGHLILTVPMTLEAATAEHYPDLAWFKKWRIGPKHVITGRRTDGRFLIDASPVFHGGPGNTLEMRVFCERDVLRHLSQAGFESQVMSEDAAEFGIFHKNRCSLPILATKR